MFLIEKLSKDVASSAGSDQAEIKKSKNLNSLIADKVKESLSQFWIPSYCKLNSLRIQEDGSVAKEVIKRSVWPYILMFYLKLFN